MRQDVDDKARTDSILEKYVKRDKRGVIDKMGG